MVVAIEGNEGTGGAQWQSASSRPKQQQQMYDLKSSKRNARVLEVDDDLQS